VLSERFQRRDSQTSPFFPQLLPDSPLFLSFLLLERCCPRLLPGFSASILFPALLLSSLHANGESPSLNCEKFSRSLSTGYKSGFSPCNGRPLAVTSSIPFTVLFHLFRQAPYNAGLPGMRLASLFVSFPPKIPWRSPLPKFYSSPSSPEPPTDDLLRFPLTTVTVQAR